MERLVREESLIDELRKVVRIDEDTGRLFWSQASNGRFTDRPVKRGIVFKGKYHGASIVAWALHFGFWPQTVVHFLDGDKNNLRGSNLCGPFIGVDLADLKKCGSYQIRNIVNGKVYAGSTRRCFHERWIDHRSGMSLGSHGNPRLQEDVRLHGIESFRFEVVEITEPGDAYDAEQRLIDRLAKESPESMYNINLDCLSPTGSPTFGLLWKGRPLPEEIRRKISAAKTGSKASDETRAIMSAAQSRRRARERAEREASK